jgi:hypothetical protein
MDRIEGSASRDANGRFVPGRSGNPAGKKQGTRNRATLLRAALAEGEDIATARIVIDKALSGDAVAARFILDRLTPRPRGRAIALDLPAGAGARDIVAAFDATLQAMASGEITPDEALTVTRVLDGKVKALKAQAREKRSAVRQKEPSPFGRGQGEGSRNSPTGSLCAVSSPHPSPLPEGEGMRTEVGERLARTAQAAGGFRAHLLNSACISPLPAATWRAGLVA